MALDMDQSQRRDIDEISSDRVTLAIDNESVTESPYGVVPTVFVGNNWFKQGDNIVKLNIAEQDSIVFKSDALSNLSQKSIVNIIVAFDYTVTNVSLNYPILSNFSLTCMGMTNYFLVENILTTQGHIEQSCSLFNFSSKVVDTAIVEQGFNIGINFTGFKSNATVKLSNVTIKFEFVDKLNDEIVAVANRVSASLDFFVEDTDLILIFLEDGQVGQHTYDDTVVALIDSKIRKAMNDLDVNVNLTLLDNGFAKIDVNLDKGDG